MLLYHSDNLINDPKIQPNYKLLLVFLDYLYSQRVRYITKNDIAEKLSYSKNHVNKLLRYFAKGKDEQAEYIRQKYLTIVFIRQGIEKKSGIYLPDKIQISFKHEDLTILSQGLSFQPGEAINQYLKHSHYFSNERPINLVNIAQPRDESSFLKALIYTDSRKKVKNAVAYLKTCFNSNGEFIYEKREKSFKNVGTPKTSTVPNQNTKIDSNYFYLLEPVEYKKLKETNLEGYRVFAQVYGTFVLICAVEGIMPQTETVLRQALKERVKPVLFINKVDRLINELKFTPEQMQERFMKLINEFNHLIEQIAEKEFGQKWKVNVNDGSVAFGSARENWALSIPFMKKKEVSFKDIYRLYTEMDHEERTKWIWANAPLYDVILDMAVKHLPNPIEAQKYRIPKIWHGDQNTEFGKSLLSCDKNGEVGFVITRIIIDPRSGKEVSAGRLYSGTIRAGMDVYLNNLKK